ncbi:MAG: hypothetical protein HXY34_03470 [Candidatus Thorarchaeota archaeon]|nr:hypothetical protein [Candidatus Thorarchaeota archaeon]
MSWTVENYYMIGSRILCVEITAPLMDFLFVEIDDVKEAWFEMLRQFANERPGYELSWAMEPRDNNALVTIRIAKAGHLQDFTRQEVSDALTATDALFDRESGSTRKAPAKRKSSHSSA